MENRISAQQAHSIASDKYEKLMSIRISEFLDEVYKKIRTSSENGMFDVSVDITINGNEYRDRISSVLEMDGYKVFYNYRDYDNQDYAVISWKILTH